MSDSMHLPRSTYPFITRCRLYLSFLPCIAPENPNDPSRSSDKVFSEQYATAHNAQTGQQANYTTGNTPGAPASSSQQTGSFHSHAEGYPVVLHPLPFTQDPSSLNDAQAPPVYGGYQAASQRYAYGHGQTQAPYQGYTQAPPSHYGSYPPAHQQSTAMPTQHTGTHAHPSTYGGGAASSSQETSSHASSSTPHTCPNCPGVTFARRHDLQRHMQSLHSDFQVKCHYCGKTYAREDSLKRHSKSCPQAPRGG